MIKFCKKMITALRRNSRNFAARGCNKICAFTDRFRLTYYSISIHQLIFIYQRKLRTFTAENTWLS